MDIHAHYTTDLKRSYRIIMRMRRRSVRIYRVWGAAALLLAALIAAYGGSWVATAIWAGVGLLGLVEIQVMLWLRLRRNPEVYLTELYVKVTDSGITRRTPIGSAYFAWAKVQGVIETDEQWIFKLNRIQYTSLYKDALTDGQRAELTAFLATRPWETAGEPSPA
jgi:hypothetical protein